MSAHMDSHPVVHGVGPMQDPRLPDGRSRRNGERREKFSGFSHVGKWALRCITLGKIARCRIEEHRENVLDRRILNALRARISVGRATAECPAGPFGDRYARPQGLCQANGCRRCDSSVRSQS